MVGVDVEYVEQEQDLAANCVISYTNSGGLSFSSLGFTALGYAPAESVTWGEWMAAGQLIRTLDRFKNFAIGDWLIRGERKWGDMYASALDEYQWGSIDKLRKLAWVSRSVPLENRRADLTWTHHHNVAALPPDEQKDWLSYAALNELSANELKQALREAYPALQSDAGTVTVDQQPQPDLPALPVEIDDLDDGTPSGAHPGIPDTTSPNAGWDNQRSVIEGDVDDDFEMVYEEDEDGKPALRVQVPDDPKKAAGVLYNTFGSAWCLKMIEQISTLYSADYVE